MAVSTQSIARKMRDTLAQPRRQFQLSIFVLFLLVGVGAVGYMLLEDLTPIEAIYMTVITLTTVGFGEVQPLSSQGQLFTIGLIVVGVGLAAWAIRSAAEITLGENLWLSVERDRMKQRLRNLENHYIVCGYGRLGRQLGRDLQARGESFVVIDILEELESELLAEGIPFILADATSDEVLEEAQTAGARGFVAGLDSDAGNVMTVLTAREMNSELLIVARASDESAESKLRRAGADRVITPESIGGHRLALALLRPAVDDFLHNIFTIGQRPDVDIGQVLVAEESALAGQTIVDCDLRRMRNISILAIRKTDGDFTLNPDAERMIEPGETLILIGPPESIYEIEALYSPESA